MWPKRRMAFNLFLAQVLVVSSHVPPAIMQSDSVFASFNRAFRRCARGSTTMCFLTKF